MPEDYFDEPVAATYDESLAAMFDDAVIEPAVAFSPCWPATAPPLTWASAPGPWAIAVWLVALLLPRRFAIPAFAVALLLWVAPRLGPEAVAQNLEPGDRIAVEYLVGVPVRVTLTAAKDR